MRALILAGMLVVPSILVGQKRPKVDSVLVTLPLGRESAMEAVATAFTQAGLTITDNTHLMVEADLGSNINQLTGGEMRRVVRGLLLSKGSSTNVLLVGNEQRIDKHGRTYKQLRIDSKAGGNGGKAWDKVVAVGEALRARAREAVTAAPTTAVVEQAPSPAGQSAAPIPRGIPPGMNWVGDSETKQYFPVRCAAVAQVPEERRYYYPTEQGVQRDGYTRGPGC